MAITVHHLPGRLRVRVPAIKADPAASRSMTAAVSAVEGVISCSANPVTGSLLIRYDTRTADMDSIAGALGAVGQAIEPARSPLEHRSGLRPVLDPRWVDASQALSKFALTLAVEKIAERSALGLIGALI